MTFVSYSQNFEDVLLWRAFSQITTGFYIDVGASHPDVDSVTRAFYDRGWSGINVEPTAAAFLRLTASRPRDVNLRMALGREAGVRPFFTVEGADSGLSTLDPESAGKVAGSGLAVAETTIPVDTLAAICSRHASADIHFLKIDVEGSEQEVLDGADFSRFRPWVVLVEATAPLSTEETHHRWETVLSGAGYHFVWFDGLNRFYVAAEHRTALAQSFRTPPNVFDDFLRAADTEWTRRLARAEAQAESATKRAVQAESTVASAQDLATAGHLRSLGAVAAFTRAQMTVEQRDATIGDLQAALERVDAGAREAVQRAARAEAARAQAEAWLEATRRSTSWRVTGPLRRVLRALGRRPPAPPAIDDEPAPTLTVPTPAPRAPAPRSAPKGPLVAVHQFHSGTAIGDAITNAMLLTRTLLRQLGFQSHIFAEHRAPGLEAEIMPLDALPADSNYVLIVRHSMGHDRVEQIVALAVPIVLLYHNITPPGLLGDTPHLQSYAVKGREQLSTFAGRVEAALADSEHNALELRRRGFRDVAACPLLFDIDRLLASAPPPDRSAIFTIIFVGRLARSKGQLELVQAFARFRFLYGGQSRLILVGRNDEDAYAAEVFAQIRFHKMDTGAVDVTGLASDEQLRRYLGQADLYVSLSRHEGFGVPLVEAMAYDLPVLALASGAVPETLGGASALIEDDLIETAVQRMLALANDPAERAAIVQRQRRRLEDFRLERHVPILLRALSRTGIEPPPDRARQDAWMTPMRTTVAGHINGTYSLAEVNRSVALALDRARPGTVRLLAVEGDLTTDHSRVPERHKEAIDRLLTRPPPMTGPHLVLSQHYPVWIPPDRGDLCLALFYWEESVVPQETVAVLSSGFDAVLAPSRAVVKALIDSGVTKPVRLLGHVPDLSRFRPLRAERTDRHDRPLTFLHVSSAFPRKGVDVLLAAYAAAFRRGDDVRLIIKCFPNPHNTTAEQLARLRAADPDLPAIDVIDRDVGEDELLELYRRADVMVLPTRGEGFNLPAAEALAAGLRLIVTGHGGHVDFLQGLPPATCRLVDFEFRTAATHLSTPFSLWAEPDHADLVAALRESRHVDRVAGEPLTLEPEAFDHRLRTIAAGLLHGRPRALSVAMLSTWDVPCGVAGYARQLGACLPDLATILADRRTPGGTDRESGMEIIPAWTIGEGQPLGDLAAAIVRRNPSAIVIQHQPGLIPWRDLPAVFALDAMHGRALCIVLHNTASLLDLEPGDRIAATAALARASRVVVHTLNDVNRLAKLELHENVTFVPQGVPDGVRPTATEPRRREPDDEVVIGCYGFLLPGKGVEQLIEALPLVQRTYPRARLVLVNALYPSPVSDAELARCRLCIERLGLADVVDLQTGFLEDDRSAELLSACDVVVLPYQRSAEASSAALRSVMAARVPVAVTPLPLFDEAESAVHRLAGIDPASIASGIVTLLADAPGRAALVDAADGWRAQRSWSTIGRRWQALLSGLVASGIGMGRDDATHPVR